MIDGFAASAGLVAIGAVLTFLSGFAYIDGNKKAFNLIMGLAIFCFAPMFLRLLFAAMFN